jgi:hypothetical protein
MDVQHFFVVRRVGSLPSPFLYRALWLDFAVHRFVAVRHCWLCRAWILCRALLSDFAMRATCCGLCRVAADGNDLLHGNAVFSLVWVFQLPFILFWDLDKKRKWRATFSIYHDEWMGISKNKWMVTKTSTAKNIVIWRNCMYTCEFFWYLEIYFLDGQSICTRYPN